MRDRLDPLRRLPQIKKIRRQVRMTMKLIDVDEIRDRLEKLHLSKALPLKVSGTGDLRKLATLHQKVQQFRDHATNLGLKVSRVLGTLKMLQELGEEILFDHPTIEEYRSQEMRNQALKRVLAPLSRVYRDLERLDQDIALVVENLDKTHYAMVQQEKSISDMLELRNLSNRGA